MRKKELRMVMTFHTTTEAMAAEKQFQDQRLIQSKGLPEIQPGKPRDPLCHISQKTTQDNACKQKQQEYPEISVSHLFLPSYRSSSLHVSY